MDEIVEPVKASAMAKLPPNAVRQDEEKHEEQTRSALRCVAALAALPEDSIGHTNLPAFIRAIRDSQTLGPKFLSIMHEADANDGAMDIV